MKLFIFTYRKLFLIGGLALVFSSFALATPKPNVTQPQSSNLLTIDHDFFDSLHISKTLDFSNKSRVFVDTASVAFSKYWEREHRSEVTHFYKSKTLERYSKTLNEQLIKAFEKSKSFEIVSSESEADLIFVPLLENLNIFAPDDSMNKSWVYRAGFARFDLKVLDARTKEVLVNFNDGRETVDRGYSRPSKANRGTNMRDFRMLMALWSKRSLEYMEELKGAL